MEKRQGLRDKVRRAYSAAAERPQDEHAFPVGRRFAESLGYPEDLLIGLPPVSVDAFSGVSNVAVFEEIQEGITVLDLGCGAGLDSLIQAGTRTCRTSTFQTRIGLLDLVLLLKALTFHPVLPGYIQPSGTGLT